MTIAKRIAPGEIFPGAYQEIQSLSTAAGGTALGTTAPGTFFILPDGCAGVDLIARNLAGGATVAQFQLSPWLTVLKTTDLLAAIANLTDYSKAAANTTTGDVVLSSLDTLANNDALYIGSHVPFAGVRCVSTAANSNASVLTVTYWDGTAWTDISKTDGTISAGATFGQTGNVTWTVPTAWVAASLPAVVSGSVASLPHFEDSLYWTRWVVSAALDASTTLASMIAINRSTAYCEMIAAFNKSMGLYKGFGGVTAIHALLDAGTGNLIVNAHGRQGSTGLNL